MGSLWVDKHRPKRLEKLDYHKDQALYLKRLVKEENFPHLLFHGPSGSGKKTRIMALLREVYGGGVDRLRIEHQTFEAPSKKKLEIVTIQSNYHIEVNPSDVGIYDRVVIQELIKTVATSQQLNAEGLRDFKVVLINEVDRLTKDAQHALRRTMEKYALTCRIILCTNSTCKVIQAIRSRCLSIRIPAATFSEIEEILQLVTKKESHILPSELGSRIAKNSHRNLRRALLLVQACIAQQYPLQPNQTITELDWEVYLRETALSIVQEQTPRRLQEVRTRIYELLVHCIPPDVIFVGLLKELVKNCDGELKIETTQLAAFYEHRLNNGNKSIYHIEAFIAKFMSIYMKFMEESMETAAF